MKSSSNVSLDLKMLTSYNIRDLPREHIICFKSSNLVAPPHECCNGFKTSTLLKYVYSICRLSIFVFLLAQNKSLVHWFGLICNTYDSWFFISCHVSVIGQFYLFLRFLISTPYWLRLICWQCRSGRTIFIRNEVCYHQVHCHFFCCWLLMG